jgi:ferredoxin
MTYVITRLCIDCKDTACANVCPVECIYERSADAPEDATWPNQLFIHPGECTDCGNCEPACLWEAIYEKEEVPDLFIEDIAVNRRVEDQIDEFKVPETRNADAPTPEQQQSNFQRYGFDGAAKKQARDAHAAKEHERLRRQSEEFAEKARLAAMKRAAWCARRNASYAVRLRKVTAPASERLATARGCIDRAYAALHGEDRKTCLQELCNTWAITADGQVGDLLREWARAAFSAEHPGSDHAARMLALGIWKILDDSAPIEQAWAALPTITWGYTKEIRARLALLARRVPDPILVGAAMDIIAKPPRTAWSSAPLYTSAFALLADHGDTATLDLLRLLEAREGYYVMTPLGECADRLAVRLEVVALALPNDLKPILAELKAFLMGA